VPILSLSGKKLRLGGRSSEGVPIQKNPEIHGENSVFKKQPLLHKFLAQFVTPA
jgi:hypothetical protein